jgi:N12 class adenine-specific DNA methylase
MMLGSLERSGSMRHKNDVTLKAKPDTDLAQELDIAIGRLPRDVMTSSVDARAQAIERFKTMADALNIAAAGDEPGSVRFNESGVLQQVMERETPEGQIELMRRDLTVKSPWSSRLLMDAQGRWFEMVPKTDQEGNKVKDGKRIVYERKTYSNDADVPDGLRLGASRLERLRELTTLRDLLKRQIKLETQDANAKQTEANREKLASAYDAFVKKHGLINEDRSAALVSEMPDGALVLALELGFKKGVSAIQAKKVGEKPRPATAKQAAILSQRVLFPYAPPNQADTPADALAISLSETGRADVERIATLLGIDRDNAIAKLTEGDKPLVFFDPETQTYETRDAYLSGKVQR